MSGIELPEGDWHTENITPDLLQSERIERVLFEGRTPYQHVRIHDGACFGRSLVLDNKTQSTVTDEFVYHESLVQPCLIAHPDPKSVFVAGGGEGATIREVLAHRSVERVTMVDIDQQVVELCREHLPDHHRGSFDDPRLHLYFEDAVKYLERTSDRYDVIIVDVPDPLEGGPAVMLYTREFYQLVMDRLTPDGLMATHAGPTGPAFYEQCYSAVARTIGSVFPTLIPYEAFIPAFGAVWGFVSGSKGPDPSALSVEEIDRRIEKRVTYTLRHYDGITQRSMSAMPKYMRQALADEDRVITRDNPLFVV